MNVENMYDAWDNGDRHEIRQQFARREEIIRMAREADPFGHNGRLFQMAELTPETLERFAALVAAAEREACAKVVDAEAEESVDCCYSLAVRVSSAIRARGRV